MRERAREQAELDHLERELEHEARRVRVLGTLCSLMSLPNSQMPPTTSSGPVSGATTNSSARHARRRVGGGVGSSLACIARSLLTASVARVRR